MPEFLGIETEIPFAPAMGAINGPNVDSIISQTRKILLSPLTFSRWGSVTYHGGQGNEPKFGRVFYHNELTGQTVNSLGLPSVSIEVMEQVYPELKKEADDRGKEVIPGVSAAAGDDPGEVLPEMVERLVAAGAERVEVNYSCPNKFDEGGNREPVLSHDIESMAEIDQNIIGRVGEGIWIIRKIAPLIGEKRELIVPTAAYFASAAGKVALSFNTVGGQSILTEHGEPALMVPGSAGGLSGPATKFIGRDMAAEFRKRLPESVQIDSPLGVMNGGEVYERVDVLRANTSSAVTVFMINEEERGMDYTQTARIIARQYYDAKEHALSNGSS